MLTTLKTAALTAALALGSAVPAAATVLNFEFFSDAAKATLLWGAKIDFGNFAFDEDVSDVTEGITLTQPAAPFDTGVASYTYLAGGSFLSFKVEGITSDGADAEYSYSFTAHCVPECVDGRGPFFRWHADRCSFRSPAIRRIFLVSHLRRDAAAPGAYRAHPAARRRLAAAGRPGRAGRAAPSPGVGEGLAQRFPRG